MTSSTYSHRRPRIGRLTAVAVATLVLAALATSPATQAAPAANEASPLLVPEAREFIKVSFGKANIDVQLPPGAGRQPGNGTATATAPASTSAATATASAPPASSTAATGTASAAALRGASTTAPSLAAVEEVVNRRPKANNNNNGGAIVFPNDDGSIVFPGQRAPARKAAPPATTTTRNPTAAAPPARKAKADDGAIAFPGDQNNGNDGGIVFPGQPPARPPTSTTSAAPPTTPSGTPTPVTRNGHVVVFEQTIDVAQVQPGAKNIFWSRLHFDKAQTKLRENFIRVDFPGFGEDLPGDILRITSLADGAVQFLNFESIAQWNFRSAVFNGGKLKIELLADPNTDPKEKPSVIVSQLETNTQTGFGSNKAQLPPPASLCTAADERKASSDPRSTRIFPVGCSAWTITDKNGCHVTAGHCFQGKELEDQIIQVNVPQSAVITTAGQRTAILRHPHPKFQFAVDTKSVQFNLTPLSGGEAAEDWAYFGTFPNPNTGMTHRETIGNKAYTLAKVDAATGNLDAANAVKAGDAVKIYGYGFVTSQARKQMSQVQQEADGKVVSLPDRFHVRHRIDTEGGCSGAVISVGDVAVGIHTNGGCTARSGTSANTGSLVSMPAFQRAIASPKGVCAA
ncbi:hypothetical protein H9P43_003648 [Blastocladiella emersonii ATCC 22665]|nr:hypothetical protein H9P43_003645 [Blastocladiella emersonii ATCC 22665]KAI9184593.1 hypothetical protein H9P43_003648 [Blastocladiella emersonii ATCC 22665]